MTTNGIVQKIWTVLKSSITVTNEDGTQFKDPWTKEVWYYDYHTNLHHMLKKSPLQSY